MSINAFKVCRAQTLIGEPTPKDPYETQIYCNVFQKNQEIILAVPSARLEEITFLRQHILLVIH